MERKRRRLTERLSKLSLLLSKRLLSLLSLLSRLSLLLRD